ncbi:MAG: MerR family transcriptional regulator [Pseudomonadales bacterium]|nr:MerR family transcriptional regulator [Pseudomonadales bacterium]
MDVEEDLYRIGTIATLTGIAVERLRAWERRYGLTPAYRSGKTRFYSRAQLEQLTRIKQLIDQGHPISTLAGLSTEQLAERVTARRETRNRPARAGLIGPNLLVLEQAEGDTTRLDVRARFANVDAFLAQQAQRPERESARDAARHATGEALEVLVVQMPVLLNQRLDAVAAAAPGARLVALYQFTTPGHLAAVQERGIPTLQWPTSWAEIEYACATTAGLPLRAARAATRRFTDEELIAIAASSTDPTRCPHHLVELISSLNAFAEYTAQYTVESAAESSDREARERARYERVHTDTTQARAQLELALEALVEAEQLLATPN